MKIGDPVKLAPAACPTCGKLLDAASQADGNGAPKSGDITVCLHCGVALMFQLVGLPSFGEDRKLGLRVLTDEEREQLPLDVRAQLAEIQRVALLVKRTRP